MFQTFLLDITVMKMSLFSIYKAEGKKNHQIFIEYLKHLYYINTAGLLTEAKPN